MFSHAVVSIKRIGPVAVDGSRGRRYQAILFLIVSVSCGMHVENSERRRDITLVGVETRAGL